MSAAPALSRVVLVIGTDERDAAAAAGLDPGPAPHIVPAPPAAEWPFTYPLVSDWPEGARIVVWAADAHAAFESSQPQHTRLVTTQAQYLAAAWAALIEPRENTWLVASVRRDVLERIAPDVLARRGVFAHTRLVDRAAPGEPDRRPPDDHAETGSQAARLAAAFRLPEPAARLTACVAALELGRTAPALVATASVCQEVNDLASAARDLDEAIALAPEWAAAHFERGKVWLRQDDMEQAARCFAAAAARLPGFGGAWGNLGATLGELDRPAEALDAFERLLAIDPASPQAHNNIGVVSRELGRLGDSEAAFRRVISMEPNLAFGHYNLGHTLFLQGRYRAAAAAYQDGQARDPERNPVQATRLALCRLATGDARGALSELQQASAALPRDYRRQVLSDTSAVLWALVTQTPDLTGWRPVHDWLNGELSKLA